MHLLIGALYWTMLNEQLLKQCEVAYIIRMGGVLVVLMITHHADVQLYKAKLLYLSVSYADKF